MEEDSTDSIAEDFADNEAVEGEAGSVAVRHCRHCHHWVTPIAPLASSQIHRR